MKLINGDRLKADIDIFARNQLSWKQINWQTVFKQCEATPAELAAENLKAAMVLGELRNYLNKKEAEQPGHLVRTGEAIRLAPSTILGHIADLEAQHQAKLDELRKAKAFEILQEVRPGTFSTEQALAQARAELTGKGDKTNDE